MKKHYIYSLLVSVFTLCLFGACSEDTMDDINNNNNYPLNADAKFIVTDLGVSTAFRTVGGDFSTYVSIYMEHETGIHNQMYRAETRSSEPTASTTYNNPWVSTYTNIKNAKLVIKKCNSDGVERGSNITLGIGRIFLAYNAAILTDLFGDVPYAQAGVLNEVGLPVYRQPLVDKQEAIYTDIFQQLDSAIVDLRGKDLGIYGGVGNKDFIYNGDSIKWRKAANALKARYLMRLLNKSSNKTNDLNEILQCIDRSFTSADEEFKFAKYDGGDQYNPLAAFSYSRQALAGSLSYAKKLKERNDPRLGQIICNVDGELVVDPTLDDFTPRVKELAEKQSYYNYNITNYSVTAPTQLLSYHELMFLKAEAYARLGGAANIANAKTALKDAIAAGFANLENSADGAGYEIDLLSKLDTYFATYVEPLFDADPLKEIMIQKYLAFMGSSGESVEAYNDYRRLQAAGEDFITLENPNNAAGKFPLRLVYGNSDVLANPNIGSIVGDGSYVYKEKVWWAGGNR